MEPLQTTTETPASDTSLIIFSTACSSDSEYCSSSSAVLRSTVPLVSVDDASMPQVNTATLHPVACLITPSESRARTNPLTTVDSVTVEPMILVTRTLSVLKNFGLDGHTSMHAFATSPDMKSSSPYWCEAMTGLRALVTSVVSRTLLTVFTASSSSTRRASCPAMMYPPMISAEWSPFVMSDSAWASSSPANTTTRFVASPASFSCMEAARPTSLAAG
mmetsp:Transcript_62271/g.147528  ORF Transcript_62271/g.147528 Transcript_62271/m.147528 type:complete len:219 (-) Transcript_62271:269-925(-)